MTLFEIIVIILLYVLTGILATSTSNWTGFRKATPVLVAITWPIWFIVLLIFGWAKE